MIDGMKEASVLSTPLTDSATIFSAIILIGVFRSLEGV